MEEEKPQEVAYREKRRKTPIVLIFLMAALCCASLIFPQNTQSAWADFYSLCGLKAAFPKQAQGARLALHVIDVGKADALLLESDGQFALIDAGTPDRGPDIADYLTARGVKTLAFAVGTHPDNDHVGGMEYVLRRFPAPYYTASSPQLALGERLALGVAELTVLGPISESADSNNSSVVLRAEVGETSFLLTGDMGEQEEKSLLAMGKSLRADVLKVGHHGSATGSTQEFLSAVRPSFAAVSVADDRNALPKKEVLKRLASFDARILRTDVCGSLLFISDGITITVKEEKEDENPGD